MSVSSKLTGYMDVGSNCLSGVLPSELGFMNKLTYLDWSNNMVISVIPTEIGFLKSLVFLDIQVNMMTGLKIKLDCNI